MKSLDPRQKIILAGISFVLVLVIVGLIFTLPPGGRKDRIPASPPAQITPSTVTGIMPTMPTGSPTPGLVVYGTVLDQQGVGVENVSIYRSYASYPGEVIATSDASGYYQSDFYWIPGDENVSIRAEKSGSVFSPEACDWRHYHGYERVECNFSAELP